LGTEQSGSVHQSFSEAYAALSEDQARSGVGYVDLWKCQLAQIETVDKGRQQARDGRQTTRAI